MAEINTLGIVEVNRSMLQSADFELNQAGAGSGDYASVSGAQGATDTFYQRPDPWKAVTVRVTDSTYDDNTSTNDPDKMALFTSRCVGAPWVMNKEVGIVQKFSKIHGNKNLATIKNDYAAGSTDAWGVVDGGKGYVAGQTYYANQMLRVCAGERASSSDVFGSVTVGELLAVTVDTVDADGQVLTFTPVSAGSLDRNKDLVLVPLEGAICDADATTIVPSLDYATFE